MVSAIREFKYKSVIISVHYKVKPNLSTTKAFNKLFSLRASNSISTTVRLDFTSQKR